MIAIFIKISQLIKKSPFWSITIVVSFFAIIFFIYFPLEISLFPENPTRKLYYIDNISEAHLKIIKKFNEKYKNEIEVIPVDLPFNHFTTNDRKEILTRSLRSRSDGIDIFAVDLIWIPRFAKWGYNMDKRFSAKIMKNVSQSALKACYHNKNLVAFPLFMDIGVLYYRKDLIRRLHDGKMIENEIRNSLTWNQFIKLGERFPRSRNPYYIFPGSNFEGMMCCYHEMLSNEESENIFYGNPIDLSKSPSAKGLQLMVDLIHKYNFSPFEVTQLDDYKSYIYANEKKAVFLRGWIGYHKQYKAFLKDTSEIVNMEIAPLPHFDGNNTSGVFGGWSLMISKFSNRKEEALKFINFMFEKENQKILYESGGYLPINLEIYRDSSYLLKHRELVPIQKILKWGKHRPFLDNYTRISEIMGRHFHKALQDKISVEEALASATAQIANEKVVLK